jgi:hypothetical protein
MSFPIKAFRRLGVAFALAAAIAAVTASVATANHQDVGVVTALQEMRGTAGSPDAVDRYLRGHVQPGAAACDAICRYNHERGTTLVTDTLGGNGNSDGINLITDTLAKGGGAASPATASTGPSDWPTVALAGTAAACATLVLFAASLLVLRRRRSVAA